MNVSLRFGDATEIILPMTFIHSIAKASAKSPLVTVALPVYNAGVFFRPCVLSLLAQSYANWELLIFDDGSNDGALQALSDINDPRIKVVGDGVNRGLVSRLNQAIDMAQGVYFARMDADDISYPERIARQVASLENDVTLDLVGAKAITIDAEDQMLGFFPFSKSHQEICGRPWLGFHLVHPTWMGRTEWFRTHRYAVPAHYLCEDQELLLRSYANSKFGAIDTILFAYRVADKPNWSKLAKTRRAMLAFQSRHFASHNQWQFWLFSLLSFIARRCVDELRRYGFSGRAKKFGRLENEANHEWRAVLEGTRFAASLNGDASKIRDTALERRA